MRWPHLDPTVAAVLARVEECDAILAGIGDPAAMRRVAVRREAQARMRIADQLAMERVADQLANRAAGTKARARATIAVKAAKARRAR